MIAKAIDYAQRRIDDYSVHPFNPDIIQMGDQAKYEMNQDCRLLADILRMLDEYFEGRTEYEGRESELFHARKTIKKRL